MRASVMLHAHDLSLRWPSRMKAPKYRMIMFRDSKAYQSTIHLLRMTTFPRQRPNHIVYMRMNEMRVVLTSSKVRRGYETKPNCTHFAKTPNQNDG